MASLKSGRLVAFLLFSIFSFNTALAQARTEISVPVETLKRYVGVYDLSPQIKMSITLDGEQLQTQLSGQPKFPLFAESETRFFLKVVDAQLDFKVDAAGKVTAAVLHQNGRDAEAPRSSDTVAERKEITLSAEALAAYAGTYAGSPLSFTVTVESGHLMVVPTGQPKLEMFAEAEDKFFLKVVDAQIEFVREAGVIKALVLHQGPASLRAERK